MRSFTVKRLRVTLVLSGANSVFPGTNSNTLTLENMRINAKVQAVARLATQADIRIFGMRAADMDALSVVWANPPVVLDNLVILEADRGNGYSQVFKGTILEAQPNYRGMPDVSFNLLAMTGYFRKIAPAEPTSYAAAVDIATVVSNLVDRMNEADPTANWSFVNGGASGTLSAGSYFWGSLWDQLAQACQATNTDFYVFGDTVLITAAGQPRDDQPAVVLSPTTGLVGYPSFERSGLIVEALYDPAFLCGTPVEIQGDIPAANGRWYPYSMLHSLDSRDPRGQWMTQLQCLRVLT